MDTLYLNEIRLGRTATNIAGIAIVILLLFFQCISTFAYEVDIGVHTGLSPNIEYLKKDLISKEKKFDSEIKAKYSNAKIFDIEKGIKHVKMTRYYNNRPVRLNIVELSTELNENISVEPTIASDILASRTKISKIAEREGAIVAINGGYFKPQTGVPLGTLMIDKKIYTGPIYDRVAMGIFDEGYDMARIQLKASVNTNIGGIKIDNVNQPRMLSTHTIVYTPDWGETTPKTPQYGKQLVIKDNKLYKITEESTLIPKDGYVIVGPSKKLDAILNAKFFTLDLRLNPSWKKVNHVISGGPYLVKNGDIYVDMTAQKLTAIGGINPRTAIGYTRDNHLIMLTADGREGASIGLTLMELAHLMKELGCVNAMNLDGGGSTVMYIDGKVVNKPAVQGGIPLSHTLTITHKNT